MKVTLLLADAVQEANGKLYVLGGGWSITGPEPTPFGIALKIEVPWDQANRVHEWSLELKDSDGKPAKVEVADEQRPIAIAGQIGVGRPPGLKQGTPIDMAVAINSGPLHLAKGHRYESRLSIDGPHEDDWRLGFSVRQYRATASAIAASKNAAEVFLADTILPIEWPGACLRQCQQRTCSPRCIRRESSLGLAHERRELGSVL